MESPADDSAALEDRFRAVVAEHGPALQRLAWGYEADTSRRQDLVQEILLGLWRALPGFAGRSSVRTWVFRVAHNIAVSHVVRRQRDRLAQSAPLDDVAEAALVRDAVREVEGRDAVQNLAKLIRSLRPADAQLILLYLEGLDHAEIAEVTGLSPENVAVKVHRIKAALNRAAVEQGVSHGHE